MGDLQEGTQMSEADGYHEEALDALESMVEQYLYSGDGIAYEHYFMSAGEFACDVLANQRPERWELTKIGIRRRG